MRRTCRFRLFLLLVVTVLNLVLTACSDISPRLDKVTETLTEMQKVTEKPLQTTASPPATAPILTVQPLNPTSTSTFQPTATSTNPPLPTPTQPGQTTSAPIVETLPEGWQRDWLQHKPCQLPCWEWLQPGTTRLDDAVFLLKQYTPIDAASITFTGNGIRGIKSVGWNWKGQKYGGGLSYEANTNNHLITEIYLQLPGSFNFKDLIQTFGEPSYIDANGTDLIEGPGYFYSLNLIWKKQGLKVAFFQVKPVVPVLDLELNTVTIEGFTPVTIAIPGNLENFKSEGFADTIKVWQGFKPFGYYCLDHHTGKPCP